MSLYAVAQGAVAIGGFIGGTGGPGGATVQKNHPTVGVISGGALSNARSRLKLFSTRALSYSFSIPITHPPRALPRRSIMSSKSALAKDASTVNICVPEDYKGYEVDFVASLGAIEVQPDNLARVVINERTGTIIATSSVRISAVAVSHGSLTITIASTQGVSQPAPYSKRRTKPQLCRARKPRRTNNTADSRWWKSYLPSRK